MKKIKALFLIIAIIGMLAAPMPSRAQQGTMYPVSPIIVNLLEIWGDLLVTGDLTVQGTTTLSLGGAITGNLTVSGFIRGDTLRASDSDDSNYIEIVWNENDSADRTLNLQVNSGDVTLDLTGGATNTFKSTISIDLTQDYLFTEESPNLAIQAQTSGTSSGVLYFTKDGDGTDNISNQIWGVGTPGVTTNRERLVTLWNAATSAYEIYTEADGTGTLRPLILYTEGNTNQLYLDSTGEVGIGIAPVTGTRLTLPLENDPVTPTLAFGDGDTGFYEISDDLIGFASSQTLRYHFTTAYMGSSLSTRFGIMNEDPSSTNPVFTPSRNDDDTGVGLAGADALSLITGGTEAVQIDSSQIAHFKRSGDMGFWTHQEDSLADDGTVSLPDATSGMVVVTCNGEALTALIQADGTVTLLSNTANCANTDSDTDLCVYDSGTQAIVKNRLGAAGEIRIIYFYN